MHVCSVCREEKNEKKERSEEQMTRYKKKEEKEKEMFGGITRRQAAIDTEGIFTEYEVTVQRYSLADQEEFLKRGEALTALSLWRKK